MHISALIDRRVGVLGMGAEGQSVVRALRRAGHTTPIYAFADQRSDVTADGVLWRHGAHHRQGLDEVDVVVRSPGFPLHHPLIQAVQERGLPMTTATNLFLAAVLQADIPVVGVTGSKGKSTTSSLIHLALCAAGKPAALVGNIGRPALDQLDAIRSSGGPVVFELSSYQCHDLQQSPTIAVLLDLFPEHMDWHGSIDAYFSAKLNIARHQRPTDRFVFHTNSRIWSSPLGLGQPQAVNHPAGLHFADGWFRHGDQKLFSDAGMQLRGLHQRRNAVSALAACMALGVAPSCLQQVLTEFQGLPHRCQPIGNARGISWFDDAISTAPEASAAAVQALGAHAHTLIVGGLDRGYDFTPLADVLQQSAVQLVITIPSSADGLLDLLSNTTIACSPQDTLHDAVAHAAAHTPPGRACLFSPGSPSYNQFRNFKHRGETFQALVKALD